MNRQDITRSLRDLLGKLLNYTSPLQGSVTDEVGSEIHLLYDGRTRSLWRSCVMEENGCLTDEAWKWYMDRAAKKVPEDVALYLTRWSDNWATIVGMVAATVYAYRSGSAGRYKTQIRHWRDDRVLTIYRALHSEELWEALNRWNKLVVRASPRIDV